MKRRSDAVALTILALLITLLFADVLFGLHSFYFRDILHYYHPAKKVLRDIVLGGEFPYWNPYFHAGQPMAANPEHEVFYPLTWLILLPSFEIGFHFLILMHLYIAAFAMYALLRSMAIRPAAAAFGAYSFAMGGIVLSCLNLLPILFSLVWMPLTCLYARRFLREHQPRHFALAAFFLGLQLIVGEPTTVVQTGLLLGLYAISARPFGRRVVAVALICTAAILVAAVQVLPTFDFFGDTSRARGLVFGVVSQWSMPASRLAELVYPNFLGRMTADRSAPYWGGTLYPGMDDAFYFSIYPGLLLTALAAGGLLARVRGARLTLAICATSIVLALGSNTPILRLLYDAGIGHSTRFPEKFIVMAVFAIVVFGSVTLDRLLACDDRVRRMTIAFTSLVVLVAIAAWAFTFWPGYATTFAGFFHVKPEMDLPALLTASRHGWLLALARGMLLLLLVAGITRMPRPAWLALAAAFMIADLTPLVPDLAPRLPSEFYRVPPAAVARFPTNRGDFRIFHYADRLRGSPAGRDWLRPQRDLPWIIRNGIPPMTPAAYGLQTVLERDLDVTSLQSTTEFTRAAFELRAARPNDWLNIVAAMSNIRYVGFYERPDVAFAKAGGNTRDVQPVRFVEGEPRPRFSFARELVRIRSREELVAALAERSRFEQVAFIGAEPFAPAAGSVRSVRQWNNGARLEVEAAGTAFLIISITAHKYWRITIDRQDAVPILTNLTYQGVVVPAGRHVVEMRYRNPLIPAGGAISAAALLGLALVSRRSRFSIRSPDHASH